MLTPREKFPLPKKFYPEEDQTHGTASCRTASPTHYQHAIPAPYVLLIANRQLTEANNRKTTNGLFDDKTFQLYSFETHITL